MVRRIGTIPTTIFPWDRPSVGAREETAPKALSRRHRVFIPPNTPGYDKRPRHSEESRGSDAMHTFPAPLHDNIQRSKQQVFIS
mmetsp:Transcript_2004/g.1458  ORF Transcript_2004/g.1458 Transcript_2004/m.1458 type:complete len:84 (-) Transcript_2004:36-287(-)